MYNHVSSQKTMSLKTSYPTLWWCLYVLCSIALLQRLPVTDRYVDAFTIITDRVGEIVVNGKTYLQHEITMTCNQYDIVGTAKEHTFYVTESLPNGGTIRRKVVITCLAPVYTYTHRIEGYIPLWTTKQNLNLCLTPYTQENRSTTLKAVGPSLYSYQVLSQSPKLLAAAQENENPSGALKNIYASTNEGMLGRFPFIATIGIPPLSIGTDISCFFGGCGSDGNIDASLANIGKQLDILTNFSKEAVAWMHTADQKFMAQNQFNIITKQSLDIFNDSIAALNREVPALWEFQKSTAMAMTEGFSQFKTQFIKQEDTTNKLFMLVFSVFNSTDQQLAQINQVAQGQAQTLQNLVLTLFQSQQRLQQKRQGTRLYWDTYDKPLVPDLLFSKLQPQCDGSQNQMCDTSMEEELRDGRIRPFLPWYVPPGLSGPKSEKGAGIPPPVNPFGNAHNIDSALRMALGSVLFSDRIPGQTTTAMAQSLTTDIICDPQYTLNNHIPSIPLKTVLERLGPDNCARDPQHWTCKCVVRIVEQSCSLPAGKLYPWDYAMRLNLAESVKQGDISGCEDAKIPLIRTSSYDLGVWMTQNVCKRPGGRQLLDRNGYAFRVMSDDMSQWWNVTLPQGPQSCAPSIVPSTNQGGVAGVLYNSWVQTYSNQGRTQIPFMENKFHGLPPDGIDTSQILYAQDQSTGATFPCDSWQYSYTSAEKLPVFSMNRISSWSGIRMQVFEIKTGANSADTLLSTIEPQVGTGTYPYLPFRAKNMSTNVQANVPQLNYLPPFMTRVGYSGHEPGIRTQWVYDVFPDMISLGTTLSSLFGKVTYIFERVSALWSNPPPKQDSGPIKYTAWRQFYKDPYDPAGPGGSPLNFRRELVRVPGVGSRCGRSFTTKNPVYDKYGWCNTEDEFDIKVNGEEIQFSPLVFSIQSTMMIPAGLIQTIVSSQCPSVSSSLFAGRMFVTMISSAPLSNVVSISVRPIGCPGMIRPDGSWDADAALRCCANKWIGTTRNFELPSRIATTIDIGECSGYDMEFNIQTIDQPDSYCFQPWLDVSSQANRSGGPDIIKPYIDSKTRILADDVANAFGKFFGQFSDTQMQLDAISRSSLRPDQAYQRIKEILRNHTIEINRIIIRNFTVDMAKIDKMIAGETKRILDNLEKYKNISYAMEKHIQRIEDLNKQSKAQLDKLDKTVKDLIEQNEKTQKAIRDFLNSHKQECQPVIPLIGDLICAISNLFSGVGKAFVIIFQIIIWICILGCLFKLISLCVSCCISSDAVADSKNNCLSCVNFCVSRPVMKSARPMKIEEFESLRCWLKQEWEKPCDAALVEALKKNAPTATKWRMSRRHVYDSDEEPEEQRLFSTARSSSYYDVRYSA